MEIYSAVIKYLYDSACMEDNKADVLPMLGDADVIELKCVLFINEIPFWVLRNLWPLESLSKERFRTTLDVAYRPFAVKIVFQLLRRKIMIFRSEKNILGLAVLLFLIRDGIIQS